MPATLIIGAGFSGVAAALHLARAGADAITLVGRAGSFGRGVAYGTADPAHLLNVPAARMGVYADDAAGFLDWLHARGEPHPPGAFVRRALYGAYLDACLAARPELRRVHGEAVGAERIADRWRVRLADGATHDADALVLATGNYPPARVPGLPAALDTAPAYVADPWAPGALDRLPDSGRALLLGTGLTMVDVAVSLAAARPALALTAVSRHGLLPRAHRDDDAPAAADASAFAAALPAGVPARVLLHEWRAWLRAHAGVDWRDAIDALRPRSAEFWRAWPLEERRRFVRHLRAIWDVHRHRIAPQVARRIDAAIASGRLAVHAGRVRVVGAGTDGLDAEIALRGGTGRLDGRWDAVVNCTGPDTRLERLPDPLLRGLAAAGWVRPDPLGLGLAVDDDGRALMRTGGTAPGLYYIGPLLRGDAWEATAVPELRTRAARLAAARAG